MATCLQAGTAQWRRLAEGVFPPPETQPGPGRLLRAFRLASAARPAAERIGRARKQGLLPRGPRPADLARDALALGLIDATEADRLAEELAARLDATEVDTFTPEAYFRDSPASAAAASVETPAAQAG